MTWLSKITFHSKSFIFFVWNICVGKIKHFNAFKKVLDYPSGQECTSLSCKLSILGMLGPQRSTSSIPTYFENFCCNSNNMMHSVCFPTWPMTHQRGKQSFHEPQVWQLPAMDSRELKRQVSFATESGKKLVAYLWVLLGLKPCHCMA